MPVTIANAVTLVRLLLTVIFFILVVRGVAELGMVVFAAAWALDAVDGLAARLLHQETTSGYFFDKIVDRFLIVGGVLSLVFLQYLPPMAMLLLAKDALVTPTVLQRSRRRQRTIDLGEIGKILTVLQGGAILWLYFGLPYPVWVTLLVAVLGIHAGLLFNRTSPQSKA